MPKVECFKQSTSIILRRPSIHHVPESGKCRRVTSNFVLSTSRIFQVGEFENGAKSPAERSSMYGCAAASKLMCALHSLRASLAAIGAQARPRVRKHRGTVSPCISRHGAQAACLSFQDSGRFGEATLQTERRTFLLFFRATIRAAVRMLQNEHIISYNRKNWLRYSRERAQLHLTKLANIDNI